MFQIGDNVLLTINDVTSEGEGVGKVEGFTVFVPKTVKGDVVKGKIISTKKTYARALLQEIIIPSENRVQPKCKIYDECGGCNLQHIEYQHQLEIKRKIVEDAICRIGGFNEIPVKHVLTAGSENYRNKMQAPVGFSDGRVIAGFYKPKSHEIVPTDNCIIQHQKGNEILKKVVQIINQLKIQPYDEREGKGIIRHIMSRVGINTGQTMLVLVVTTTDFPQKEGLVERIKKVLPDLTTLVFNINNKKTNVILGTENVVSFGKGHIEEISQGIKFKISPLSFFQVNPKGMEVLYQRAVEYAGLTGKERVIDAYCGLGSISLFMAKKAKEVLGIEIVPQAVRDAKENAKLNNIDNVTFIEGKAEDVMVDLAKKGEKYDVVVVDPPRKGCEASLLAAIKEIAPQRVVYVSCNPATLARDLKILCEEGMYTIKEVQPVDMFPHTSHVECVVFMSRVEK
ncbi:23S rRNA (uracil1939-C5)-methyltransferase [Anaerobranca californiensis DSM 14826]|jgi:23S rRNA (uracil1939-C5)-methyltransferase|uniref:23S rRNA (Uracil1939-C5)-methyltransferase n=1 Tax=Anaerobranca californiensis DSM 14826 TaxID=1120989 RepID=A0A1M6QEE3_9FIRM|nr:23S rRNA (uracil(1939)-C(5))-methyltransferase RlmD [Anaerobranca californiensis]SHK18566.1 23S rRNA (uracil1939-C5)-methyltransferase [Anaerobranca californiensis DSM 14826]